MTGEGHKSRASTKGLAIEPRPCHRLRLTMTSALYGSMGSVGTPRSFNCRLHRSSTTNRNADGQCRFSRPAWCKYSLVRRFSCWISDSTRPFELGSSPPVIDWTKWFLAHQAPTGTDKNSLARSEWILRGSKPRYLNRVSNKSNPWVTSAWWRLFKVTAKVTCLTLRGTAT